MSEFLVEALLGKMLVVSTNKLFEIPLGLFFECCGIARDVSIIIDKIKVFIDFHIYTILEFDILIGYPIEKLFKEKPSQGSLKKKLRKTVVATPISCPKSPMAKHNPNHDPFEEVKFISSFAYEIERIPSPSLEPKPCPSGHPNVILDSGRDSTLIMHDRYFEKEKKTFVPWTSCLVSHATTGIPTITQSSF
jgi:hypothetical protein